jgi:uncharacterized protein (DUF1697 family)
MYVALACQRSQHGWFSMLIISLLRGVNVGPYRRMKMADLRAVYAALRLGRVETYAQSGNVLFRTEERDLVRLAKRIEDAIERRFRFRPNAVLRTLAELREVVASNPFASQRRFEAGKLFICFLAKAPGDAALEKIGAMKISPEVLRFHGRELYIYFPTGMAGSKLPMAQVEQEIHTAVAGRKWSSVTRLLCLAIQLEAGG